MLNDKINNTVKLPVLFSGLDEKGCNIDPFAFARRLHTALWVFDIDTTKILHANAGACELWQADDEISLKNRDLSNDMSPTVERRLKQYQADFIERDASFTEMWTLYPKGLPVSVMVVFRGLYLPDGRMAMLCEVIGNAIDEPNNLRSAEALLHTDVMISLYELDGPALYMNPAARNASDRTIQGVWEKFCDPDDYHELLNGLTDNGHHRKVTMVLTSGGPRWHDISIKRCADAVTGNPVILETAIDVSELKNARDKARYLAERDQLTGCYNRTFLAQYVTLPERFPGEQKPLISFDVDHFKQINDRFGHEMGDRVLKKIVARARKSMRRNDIIIRLGGDEFVVIFEDISTQADLSERIKTLHRNISAPMTFGAIKLNVTVSTGATKFSAKSPELNETIREADIALYASKQAGRNQVTYFDQSMGEDVKERITLETDLQHSIKNKDFKLHFQPRIDLQSGKVVSAEGLIRWQHPERGLVMPDNFIPICEETGMIEDLGRLVLELGSTQANKWHIDGLDIDVSLNISPRQFQDDALLRSLEELSRNSDFRCDKMELEITESVLIGDLDEIEKKLKIISQMGFRIAIDDFGTGYSNLSYISQFPLDCLKIDQSFINQLPRTGPIISLILTLAKQIGATVVAEGVETQEQLDWLIEHDCDQAQGYLLSRPVDIKDLEAIIGKLNRST